MKVLVLLLLVSLVAAEPGSPSSRQERSPDDDVILFYGGRGGQGSSVQGRTNTGFDRAFYRPRYFMDFDDLYDDRRKRQTALSTSSQGPAVRRQKRDADFDDDDDDRVYVYHGTTSAFLPASYSLLPAATSMYAFPGTATTYTMPTARTTLPAAATTYTVRTARTSFVPSYVPTSRYFYIEHDDDDDKRKKRSADFDFDDDDDYVTRYVLASPGVSYSSSLSTTQPGTRTFAPISYVYTYDDK